MAVWRVIREESFERAAGGPFASPHRRVYVLEHERNRLQRRFEIASAGPAGLPVTHYRNALRRVLELPVPPRRIVLDDGPR